MIINVIVRKMGACHPDCPTYRRATTVSEKYRTDIITLSFYLLNYNIIIKLYYCIKHKYSVA